MEVAHIMSHNTHRPFFDVGQLEVDLLRTISNTKFLSEAPSKGSSVSVRSPALLLLVHRVEEGALQDEEGAKGEPAHQLKSVGCYMSDKNQSIFDLVPLWKQ